MEEGMSAKVGRTSDVGQEESWFANIKRTYDEYQKISLISAAHGQTAFDQLHNVSLQALQNAVETANMVGKQALRPGDIAIDGQWNPVQQGAGDTLTARAVSIDDVSLKAIGAIVAAAVADALGKKA